MLSVQQVKRTYYTITFLISLATALLFALWVPLMQARGLSAVQISTMVALYSLTVALLEVPTGGLADAFGRKRVALAAYSALLVADVVYFFAFSLAAYIAYGLIFALGRALASGALEAWFIDALQAQDPDVDLQPSLAVANTVELTALGVGPLIGSSLPYLFPDLPPDGTAILTPYAVPVLGTIAVRLLALFWTWRFVHEVRDHAASWRDGFASVPTILRTGLNLSRGNPTLLLLFGASFASGVLITTLETHWPLRLIELLGTREGNSIVFGLSSSGAFLMGLLGNLLATRVSGLFHKRYALVGALMQGLMGLALVGLAFQGAVVPAFAFFYVAYLAIGLRASPYQTLLNREIPAAQRSSMLSISSLVFFLGTTFGTVTLGFLIQRFSFFTAWTSAGALIALTFGLYLAVDRRRRTPS